MISKFVCRNDEFCEALQQRSSRIMFGSGDLCVGCLFLVVEKTSKRVLHWSCFSGSKTISKV